MKLAFILGIISMTIAIGDSKEMQRAGEMRDEVNDRYRYCEPGKALFFRWRKASEGSWHPGCLLRGIRR